MSGLLQAHSRFPDSLVMSLRQDHPPSRHSGPPAERLEEGHSSSTTIPFRRRCTGGETKPETSPPRAATSLTKDALKNV